MKRSYCSHCGSTSHRSFDCSRQSETWTPTPEFLAEQKAAEEFYRGGPDEPEPILASRPAVREPTFEPTPRWLGAPKTCTATNLLAFADEKSAAKWLAKNCPHATIEKSWVCDKCGLTHFACHARHESGQLPHGFVPFERDSTRQEAKDRAQATRDGTFRQAKSELPQGDSVKPAREVVLPKARKKVVEKGLF